MKNFDCFIAIDWSGAKSPVNTRAIAVASIYRGASNINLIEGPWSRQKVADYIDDLITQNDRILIGIDCNFGYAKEIVQKQCGVKTNAFDLWATVENSCHVDPNFFAGGFWNHDRYKHDFWTSGKMPDGFQKPKRITETICGETGYGWPESPFKLIGAKQVGKGGLAGMRLAHYLKQKHHNRIAMWPFETIEICDTAQIVITEIYPRQFIKRTGLGSQKIRTCDDLNSVLKKLNNSIYTSDFHYDHDTDAIIAAAGLKYLCGDGDELLHQLSAPMNSRTVLETEGWIFGAGYDKANA